MRQIGKGKKAFSNSAATYPAPITDYQKTRATWAAMLAAERDQAIIGAKGYRAYVADLACRGKTRVVKDAHRWLRDRMWLGYVQTGKAVDAVAQRFNAAENSDEWKAWTVFYRICGMTDIPSFLIRGSVANAAGSNGRRLVVNTIHSQAAEMGQRDRGRGSFPLGNAGSMNCPIP